LFDCSIIFCFDHPFLKGRFYRFVEIHGSSMRFCGHGTRVKGLKRMGFSKKRTLGKGQVVRNKGRSSNPATVVKIMHVWALSRAGLFLFVSHSLRVV
jgi:hypothetical protein